MFANNGFSLRPRGISFRDKIQKFYNFKIVFLEKFLKFLKFLNIQSEFVEFHQNRPRKNADNPCDEVRIDPDNPFVK